MTASQIAADIERGLFLKAEIARLVAELKAIESRLESAGLDGEQIPLQDAEREGKQYLAQGLEVSIPVRFESDQLISSFNPESDLHKAILAIVGEDKLALFFKEVRKFERVQKDDANKFRKLARKHLEPDQYARLINVCISRLKSGIPKSKTVIAWDDAKPLDQAV